MRPKLRLFTETPLALDAVADLEAEQTHYLARVMRARPGDSVILFNGHDGEWQAQILTLERKSAQVRAVKCLRAQTVEPDIWLAFAPPKGPRLETVIEKATELGVRLFWPVLTEHTVPTRVNLERLNRCRTEAAEQCERLSLPEIRDALSFDSFLAQWPQERRLFYLDETGRGTPIRDALAQNSDSAHGFLIGPEGGFAKSELDALARLPFACAVGMGPRILRADTAAIAALACWQALRGDGAMPTVGRAIS